MSTLDDKIQTPKIRMQVGSPWGDPVLDQRLTELWNEVDDAGQPKHSSARIADMIGVTKNSVIGRTHRLKLTQRGSPIGAWKKTKQDPKINRWRQWFRKLSLARRDMELCRPHTPECPRTPDTPWDCGCGGGGPSGYRWTDPSEPIQAPHKPAERVKVVRPPAPPPRVYHRPIGAPKTCQYPTNDGARMQWTFCDDPTLFRASSYCQAHHGVCYGGGR